MPPKGQKRPRTIRLGDRRLRTVDLQTVEGVRDLLGWTALAIVRGTITEAEGRATTQACQAAMDAMIGVAALEKKRAREAAAPRPEDDTRVNDP